MIALGTYLKTYRVGDIVDVKANGAVQKGVSNQILPQCLPDLPQPMGGHARQNRRQKRLTRDMNSLQTDASQSVPRKDRRHLQRDQIGRRRHHLQESR